MKGSARSVHSVMRWCAVLLLLSGCASSQSARAPDILGQLDGLLNEAVLNDLLWSKLTVVGLTDEQRDQPLYQTSDALGSLYGMIEGRSLNFSVVADPTREGVVLARCTSIEHPEIFYSFFRTQGTKVIRIASTTSPDTRLFGNATSVAVPVSSSWFGDYLALAAKDTRYDLLRRITREYAKKMGYRGHFFIAPTTPRSAVTRAYWLEESRFLRIVVPTNEDDVQNAVQFIRETERPAFAQWAPRDEEQRLWNETLAMQHYRDAWICSTFGTCVSN